MAQVVQRGDRQRQSRLIVTAPAREPEPLAEGLVPPQEDETANAPQGCDQIEMGPIPVPAVNVLWAADDRFFCTCASHTESHKEMRERELLFVTAPRSQTMEVCRAVALALGRLESLPLTMAPLIVMLNDPSPAVRAEAVNALAQSAKTPAECPRRSFPKSRITSTAPNHR